MKEKGLLVCPMLVPAILDDSKTQTRRIANTGLYAVDERWHGAETAERARKNLISRCPHGQPGDRRWVRETFYAFGRWETRFSAKKQRDEWHFVDMTQETDRLYQYDTEHIQPCLRVRDGGVLPTWYKRPSIFMPRAACRTVLEITGIRLERLGDISEDDCWAEGIDACDGILDESAIFAMAKRLGRSFEDALPTYAVLWESLHGLNSFDVNLFVWVIDFKRIPA